MTNEYVADVILNVGDGALARLAFLSDPKTLFSNAVQTAMSKIFGGFQFAGSYSYAAGRPFTAFDNANNSSIDIGEEQVDMPAQPCMEIGIGVFGNHESYRLTLGKRLPKGFALSSIFDGQFLGSARQADAAHRY